LYNCLKLTIVCYGGKVRYSLDLPTSVCTVRVYVCLCLRHLLFLFLFSSGKHHVMVYLEDAIDQLLEHKDDAGKVNASKFFAT